MSRCAGLVLAWGLLAAAAEPAAGPAGPEAPAAGTPGAEGVAGALVRVEYWLKTNSGEEPEARNAPAGRRLLEEERPLELGGFLLAANKVIAPDPLIHPRFVRRIAVRFGEESAPARVAGYAQDQPAVLLDLDRPLKGARPLAFPAETKPPHAAVTWSERGGEWVAAAEPLALAVSVTEGGRKFRSVPANCLILGAGGAPAGMAMGGELPADDSWKGPPLKWPIITAERMAKRLDALERRAGRGLLRVTLSLRSPRKGSAPGRPAGGARAGGDGTVREAIGVLLEGNRVLVLEELRPGATARLERITVHSLLGAEVRAKFVASLAEYGALVVELDKPLAAGGAVALTGEGILKYRNVMLMAAEIGLYGETRLAVYEHNRITAFEPRWQRRLYPRVSGREDDLFLFDPLGVLVALPVAHREPVTMEPHDPQKPANAPRLTPAAYLREALADLARHGDPANVPLSEEHEGRLAWMGVILQPMNRELARIHEVSVETRDGETGALVAYVYPESPAAKAGIRPGAVLLRLHVQDRPAPLEVRVGDDEGYYDDESLSWDDVESLPESAYGRVARPWTPAEDALTRALTDLGLGKKYAAEFRVGPLVVKKNFEVAEGPAHFDSAPRFKSGALGLTVRDVTFEVRRYFQMKREDPGVIVSALEPGSKAAVAGIRPFEIIVQVNGQPVKDVRDFEKLSAGADELRLAVKRLMTERQVKIRVGAGSKPAAAGAPAAPSVPAKAPEPPGAAPPGEAPKGAKPGPAEGTK